MPFARKWNKFVCLLWGGMPLKNQQENSKSIKSILLTNGIANVFCTIFNLSKSFLSFISLFLHFILHFFIISNIFYLFTMKRITFSFFYCIFVLFLLLTLFQILELFLAFLTLWFYLTVWKFICFKYWKWNVLIYVEIFHWKYFSYFSSHK